MSRYIKVKKRPRPSTPTSRMKAHRRKLRTEAVAYLKEHPGKHRSQQLAAELGYHPTGISNALTTLLKKGERLGKAYDRREHTTWWEWRGAA